MTAKGGIETAIAPHTVRSALTGRQYDMTPGNSEWFGPGVPQLVSAPPSAHGRQFDLPIAVNIVNTTKNDGLSFSALRMLADACDIIRLLIETRKDQICGLTWAIRHKDKGDAKKVGEKPAKDDRIDALTAFFQSPDHDHTWSEWLRLLLEDLFVLDAPTLYVQRTVGGDLYALRPVDGGTIKRVIDGHGWTPPPPNPAFQQILKGVVSSEYTTDEMIYKPRNRRTNKIYGYSNVEQTIVTAKQWLARQASNIEYYDTGNLPEGFLQGGKDWTPEQIVQFQTILDAMLSGNLAERRKARVVPEGSIYTAVKEPALKSDYDEWLARIACFCFGYPPSAFIKQMNRSTSETDKQSSEEEGTEPIKQWVKELIDGILQQRLGYTDLEFGFQDKEAQDPLARAQIDQIYLAAGVLEINEVRADLGLMPLANPNPAAALPKTGAVGAKEDAPQQDDKKKVTKAATDDLSQSTPDPEPVDLDAPTAVSTRTTLAKAIAAALELAAESIAKDVSTAIADGETNADMIVDRLVAPALAEVEGELKQALTAVAEDADASATVAMGMQVEIKLVNQRAASWANARAAQLITSNGAGGELLDATRDLIRADVAQAITDGLSSKQLAKVLADNYAFSKTRAQTIAQTEIAKASVQGHLHAWIASGVVKRKRWVLGENACVVCQANADQGEIPLLLEFKSGDIGPPGHPRCRCSLAPYVD